MQYAFHKWMVIFMAVVLLVCGSGLLTRAMADSGKLDLDLVLVIDQSNTMYSSTEPRGSNDQEGFRMDAAGVMLSLCDTESSRAAAILFNNKIDSSNYCGRFFDISVKAGNANRAGMIKILQSKATNVNADTDTGLALMAAVDLILDNPSERRPVILLLTDGGIMVMNNPSRKTADSEADFEAAVEKAAAHGIKIYTIALSGGKPYETDALYNASVRTGGLFNLVSSGEDLPNVFNRIFANEIESEVIAVHASEVKEDENGIRSLEIPIPNRSVVEANIMVAAESDECELFTPGSSRPVEVDGESVISFKTNHFAVYKIVDPQQTGNWVLRYKPAVKQANADINIIFSYDVTPVMAAVPAQDLSKVEETTLTVQFVDGDGRLVDDPALYLARENSQGIVAEVTFASENGEQVYKQGLVMDKYEDRFELRLPLQGVSASLLPAGTYQVIATLQGDGMNAVTEPFLITVRNRAPELIGRTDAASNIIVNDPTASNYGEEAPVEIDLNTLFREPEGETMHYELVSGAEDAALSITLEGSLLRIAPQGQTVQTTLMVAAADEPDGASTLLDIPVNVTSIRNQLQAECVLTVSPVTGASKGASVILNAQLLRNGQPVTDEALLSLVQPALRLSRNDGETSGLTFALNRETAQFEAVMETSDTSASYRIDGEALMRDFAIRVEGTEFSVGNVAPVRNEELLAALPETYRIRPLLWANVQDEELVVELATLFTDTPDDTLRFTAYQLTEEQQATDDVTLVQNLMVLTALPLTEDNVLQVTHTEAGHQEILLVAVDSDNLWASARHSFTVVDQKQEVIKILTAGAIGLAALIFLIVMCYKLIYRKAWKATFGVARPEIDGVQKAVRAFPVRGKKDVMLGTVLDPSDLARKDSELYNGVRLVKDACRMRPKSHEGVELKLLKPLPDNVDLRVNKKRLKKKGDKALWPQSSQLTIEVLNGGAPKVALMRIRQNNAGASAPKPASGGHQVQL